MHGEVKASSACNRNGYQYCLTGITAGQSRDIYVKVHTSTFVGVGKGYNDHQDPLELYLSTKLLSSFCYAVKRFM